MPDWREHMWQEYELCNLGAKGFENLVDMFKCLWMMTDEELGHYWDLRDFIKETCEEKLKLTEEDREI